MAYTISNVITDKDEINALFSSSTEDPKEEELKNPDPEVDEPEDKQKEEIDDITETTIEDLFGTQEESGRVGNDKDKNPKSEKEEPSSQQDGSSPNPNLYSSITDVLEADGLLSLLSQDELKSIKDAESLGAAMKKQIEEMRNEDEKRIASALDAGVQPSQISWYENTINNLENLTEEEISAETPDGEKLRKALIYQYLITRGDSEERANKMMERAFAGGTDIEDAKDYAAALKEYYKNEYSKLIEEKKKSVQEAKQREEAEMKKYKKMLLEDKNIFGDIDVDAKTRKLAFENWVKPTHRDEKGNYQSELQKYATEHPMEFQMYSALLYTLTDGFTKMGNVLKQNVKKEKKKALTELENVINNTQRTPYGGIDLKGSDPNSIFNGIEIAPQDKW